MKFIFFYQCRQASIHFTGGTILNCFKQSENTKAQESAESPCMHFQDSADLTVVLPQSLLLTIILEINQYSLRRLLGLGKFLQCHALASILTTSLESTKATLQRFRTRPKFLRTKHLVDFLALQSLDSGRIVLNIAQSHFEYLHPRN